MVSVIGVGLLISALSINDAWIDRHFLPDYFKPPSVYHGWASIARVVLALAGAATLLWLRPVAGRFAASRPPRELAISVAPTLVAMVLALVASELILRTTYWRIAAEAPASPEPRVRADPRLGWTFVPARTGRVQVGGRLIDYAFDARGYRVPAAGQTPDPGKPTILFAGESIMEGYGLTWAESIPAQVQSRLGVQTANASVVGYSTDQVYLRLQQELPRFSRPLAVVLLFTPTLMAKNLSTVRPHLGPGLVWIAPRRLSRLQAIGIHAVPYHSDAAIAHGVAMTRAVLRASVDMARARGAVPLIVTPVYGREEPAVRDLRRRILDEEGLPYVLVPLDPAWKVPGDGHPDARGARAIADAVAARLSGALDPRLPRDRAIGTFHHQAHEDHQDDQLRLTRSP